MVNKRLQLVFFSYLSLPSVAFWDELVAASLTPFSFYINCCFFSNWEADSNIMEILFSTQRVFIKF